MKIRDIRVKESDRDATADESTASARFALRNSPFTPTGYGSDHL
jgi:hypothetical protein